jgi:hypothetical protein
VSRAICSAVPPWAYVLLRSRVIKRTPTDGRPYKLSHFRTKILLSAVALLLLLVWLSTSAAQEAVITIDPSVTYQTISGWEADQLGPITLHDIDDVPAREAFLANRDAIHDLAIDLGINRVRVEVVSPGPKQRGADFDLEAFDNEMREAILPYRRKLQAQGQKLWINICVVGSKYADNPQGYARKVLLFHQHMQSKYGFLPDSWEVALEPDVFGWQTTGAAGIKLGKAIFEAGSLLRANGFPSRIFVAPSASNIYTSQGLFDDAVRLAPNCVPFLAELSYHLYHGKKDDAARAGIKKRAEAHGLRTSMLELIAGDYSVLHADLKHANVSAWQQYVLFGVAKTASGTVVGDDGSMYLIYTNHTATPRVVITERAKFLRQYFRFVLGGARRVEAKTTNLALDPVAFVNQNGTQVVIVKAAGRGTFAVNGLQPGTYGIKYTTVSQYNIDAPTVSVTAGQALTASIPDAGVITIYGTSTPTSQNFRAVPQ